ncbi:16S rRNA (cytidine(1402)-2'-O)-methyltransferase [Candidatus Woesearchaeota archaeon]|nr:16S rRNA (cytidine(1402)-2'-O)-methyltransferase [Candidatus Woesearchaeota archaeon]
MVSTPIGNLKDISLRAIEILNSVELIAAEDTRRTNVLLMHHDITNRLISFNDHNKEKTTPRLIQLLKQNKDIALVSDAGTPGISDPGFYLVREAVKENIQISPIPGPTAMISALICSGLPTDKFTFYGFLPKSTKKKIDIFNSLKTKKETAIFYESPYRIIKTIDVMNEIFPEKNIVLARELTKKFEEFMYGTVNELYKKLKDKTIKGEIVLILQ